MIDFMPLTVIKLKEGRDRGRGTPLSRDLSRQQAGILTIETGLNV